jgi:hypothetical protein
MPYPEHDLIDTVKALPAQRQHEVQEFIALLAKSDEIVAAAMVWITDHLPDRYCAGEPRFDVQTLSWRVPVLLSYPSGKGGEVGELIFDARSYELSSHTALEEIRNRGRRLAAEFQNV